MAPVDSHGSEPNGERSDGGATPSGPTHETRPQGSGGQSDAQDKTPPTRASIAVSDGALIPDRNEKQLFSSWRIAFYGAITLLVALPVFSPSPYREVLAFIPDGVVTTFHVTMVSIVLSLIIGLITGLGRISRNTLVNRIATIYVEVVRGIPLLVQLFYIYYALGQLVQVPRLTAAIIAMSVCYGAYMGEIFRAGLQSVPKGQMEAALALGLSRRQALRKIIIPQTFLIVLPPVGNEFIALLKDSSLVSIIAVADLLRRGREYASVSFNYFETYTVVALVYLVITLFLSKVVSILERWVQNRGV